MITLSYSLSAGPYSCPVSQPRGRVCVSLFARWKSKGEGDKEQEANNENFYRLRQKNLRHFVGFFLSCVLVCAVYGLVASPFLWFCCSAVNSAVSLSLPVSFLLFAFSLSVFLSSSSLPHPFCRSLSFFPKWSNNFKVLMKTRDSKM